MKIVVKNSPIEGKGVFATGPVKKGDVVCIMKGNKISIPELKLKYKRGDTQLNNLLQVSERQYLNLIKPYIYINHSCNPNAAVIKNSTIIALKDIKLHKEITFDYSTTEWTDENLNKYHNWSMICCCGSKKCRKRIVQFSLLPEKLKRQYLTTKAVPDFIMRKAKALKKVLE